ncbi:hypothetical protein P3342_004415 [Pyrenophora teres f. teres]|uniref:Uncharacterized protein n=1 Tax=Pyrenophora teres f. teres TaxID=97479 RepID=A0A6S6VFZ4_9PLEO|nr:hypothetical protein P3342_004415 [Pyrenophora teres f. teres]CAE7020414.1 hypothetical protein PTTW11_03060 [Pyrenophora teres f. teres]
MIRIEEPMATLARISNVGVVAGRGLVASQEIERGALIVQENALVCCNTTVTDNPSATIAVDSFFQRERNGFTNHLQIVRAL